MLISHFKRGVTPRPEQRYILDQLDNLLKSGYRNIIVSAPTGVGKSYIAKAIAGAMDDTFVVTSTKQLQNQYLGDFPDMRSIKGKSNFECYQLMDRSHIGTRARAMAQKLTCEKGQCTVRSGRRIISTCKYRNPEWGERHCVYYKQKSEGLEHSQTVLNYAMYFQLKKFQHDLPGVSRRVAVFDEAHAIENEIVRFSGYDVPGSYLAESGVDQRSFDLESVRGILKMLAELREFYGRALRELGVEDGGDGEPNQKGVKKVSASEAMRVKRLTSRYENVTSASMGINEDTGNYVAQEPVFDSQGSLDRVSVVPLDVSKYVPSLFDSDIQIFMSGTIERDIFSKIMGIDDCGYIDVPKSPFAPQSRRVSFLDVARLSSRSPESDEIRVATMIDRMMSMHQNSRGLILTSSRARCHRLLRRLSGNQARRVQMAHSENEDKSTIGEVLDAHADTSNGVLLSSSLWQGVDLKGDLSRFQIIEKCPYPYLGDRRVEAKSRMDWSWYVYQTVVKILQGLGRSVRDQDDSAVTYVMDSAVHDILDRNRSMVPSAYHDVLYRRV